jgi:transposase InsO family protein
MRSYRGLALEMALAQRVVPAGLIHHSDRGKQYCSNVYVGRFLDVGASKSHVHSWPANRECIREIALSKP